MRKSSDKIMVAFHNKREREKKNKTIKNKNKATVRQMSVYTQSLCIYMYAVLYTVYDAGQYKVERKSTDLISSYIPWHLKQGHGNNM